MNPWSQPVYLLSTAQGSCGSDGGFAEYGSLHALQPPPRPTPPYLRDDTASTITALLTTKFILSSLEFSGTWGDTSRTATQHTALIVTQSIRSMTAYLRLLRCPPDLSPWRPSCISWEGPFPAHDVQSAHVTIAFCHSPAQRMTILRNLQSCSSAKETAARLAYYTI